MVDGAFNVAECLARVRQQDQAAARALVDYLYPTVIKMVRARLPRRAAEEDLAQSIFMNIFANLDQYEGAVPIEHWVSRIAVNHCLNAIRAQKIRPEWRMADLSEEQAEVLETVTTFATDQSDPVRAIAARELVEKLLESLSPEDRLVIQMLEIEERSIAEIQQVTGWSATMIRVRAFRARRKLNKRFGKLRKEGKL
jgi:RNA polymerase sigma-70 factor (ECF subfamily)